MSLTNITFELLTHLENQVGLPPIYYPNTDGDVLPSVDHLQPSILPANTDSIGLATTDQEIGILQVSIFVEKGKGELESARIADAILAAFPRNLALNGVRIDETGSVSSSFFDGNWQITPVSIPYQNIA